MFTGRLKKLEAAMAAASCYDAWKDAVSPGTSVAVEVLSFDPERKRIGVALVDEESARARGAERTAIAPGARLTGKVERHERYGVFVFLAPGRTGLMPIEETVILRGLMENPQSEVRISTLRSTSSRLSNGSPMPM